MRGDKDGSRRVTGETILQETSGLGVDDRTGKGSLNDVEDTEGRGPRCERGNYQLYLLSRQCDIGLMLREFVWKRSGVFC